MNKLKSITDKIIYATIATTDKTGQPWNSPVWSMHDEDYTYYWCSWKDAQHSKNIRDNNKIFIVIYDSTVPPGKGEGVYIQAKAYEVTKTAEIDVILTKRALTDPTNKRHATEFQGDYPRRWYKAIPEKVWLNEDGKIDGNFIDIRKQVV